MMRLSNDTLNSLPPDVAVPTYDRHGATVGWVHLGVGGFHRAHQAVYLDDLLGLPDADRGWGLCGIGLLDKDAAMRNALVPQDGLYTVIERNQSGDRAHVAGAMVQYLFAPDDGEAVMERLTTPQTRIVSLTITEGGYGPGGGAARLLAQALDRRRQAELPPFTVLSCDNLQHNGAAARRITMEAAREIGPDLAAWVEERVTFPNCMVDRITPQTSEADRALARALLGGVEDAWPVVCEPFRQWVIEDKFCQGRPALERVGAQFVPDVGPYETMKIRLLNAGHSALGYPGALVGFSYIHEVASDALFARYLQRLWDDEVTPLLPPIRGVDLGDYKATLLQRFGNPKIGDTVARICLDGSAKVPGFVLPSVREALAQGRPARLLTLAVAAWMRYLNGMDDAGRSVVIEDPRADELRRLAREGGPDPRPLLDLTDLFGDLGQRPEFVRALSDDLGALYAHGARATLATAVG